MSDCPPRFDGKKHLDELYKQLPDKPIPREQVIAEASPDDVNVYGRADQRTCGTCRYFEYEHGQQAIKRQRFLERLVLEEGWKTRHMGAAPSTFGVCGAGDGSMITSCHSKACDQYNPRLIAARTTRRK